MKRILEPPEKSRQFSKSPKMDKLILKDIHILNLNILRCDKQHNHKYYMALILDDQLDFSSFLVAYRKTQERY